MQSSLIDEIRKMGAPAWFITLVSGVAVGFAIGTFFFKNHSRDNVPASPNEQRPNTKGRGLSNEQLHATHLHITVDEPKLIKKS